MTDAPIPIAIEPDIPVEQPSLQLQGGMLLIEVGTIHTRVTLLDDVDDETRVIGQAEVGSSLQGAVTDSIEGIYEACMAISELTGHELVRSGQLITPQNDDGSGVNAVLAVTSAAGTMDIVIAAVSSQVSARTAQHVARSIPSSILHVVTLDHAAGTQLTRSDERQSWAETQLSTLAKLHPNAVLIAGRIEGESGSFDALNRLIHLVSFAFFDAATDDHSRPAVLFAGSSHMKEHVEELLGNRTEVILTENLRPDTNQSWTNPARTELTRLYSERILPKLPGFDTLRTLCTRPVLASSEASAITLRYIAERHERRVLALDAGSSTTSAALAAPGQYTPAVLGGCGIGIGLGAVLGQRGPANIARWLPFAIRDDDLVHWVLNKMLRPHIVPTTREDLFIEQALAREALILALEALQDEETDLRYDMVIASGATLGRAPSVGATALMLLDILPPPQHTGTLAIDLHADALGLMGVSGALATRYADSAVSVIEKDLLMNQPLATCIILGSEGKAGEPAIEAELIPLRGKTQKIRVAHGEIARLPLHQGTRAQLTLRPAKDVRIGNNAPGVEVSSDLAAIGGSALGVIIDARGRPLVYNEVPALHAQRVWSWMVALGMERGEWPYSASEDQEEPVFIPESRPYTELSSETKKGQRISLEDLAAELEPNSTTATLPAPNRSGAGTNVENDLQKLRESIQPQKKGGWFKR